VSLQDELDALANETSFSGAVRIDRGDDVVIEKATAWPIVDTGSGMPPTRGSGSRAARKGSRR
jgi:hypothetical protein